MKERLIFLMQPGKLQQLSLMGKGLVLRYAPGFLMPNLVVLYNCILWGSCRLC